MKVNGFQAKWPCYGHVHGTICLNESILCKSVRFSMAHNVAQGSFQLSFTKNTIFIFWVRKRGHFVKHLPRICCKIVPPHFRKILNHILSRNNQLLAHQRYYRHLLWKDKFQPIQQEADQIWTTSASLVDHDFFQKSFLSSKHIISREIH